MSVLSGQTWDEYGHYKYGGAYEAIPAIIEAYCGPHAAESKQRFFDYFAASCMMRNGDAHLKNFGLLYGSPDDPASVRRSPMYDVVTTSACDLLNGRTGRVTQDRELALKLNKSRGYPDRHALLAFGQRCNVLRTCLRSGRELRRCPFADGMQGAMFAHSPSYGQTSQRRRPPEGAFARPRPDRKQVLRPGRVLERISAGMSASLAANRDRVAQIWPRMNKEWDMGRMGLETRGR